METCLQQHGDMSSQRFELFQRKALYKYLLLLLLLLQKYIPQYEIYEHTFKFSGKIEVNPLDLQYIIA